MTKAGETDDQLMARVVIGSYAQNALTIQGFAKQLGTLDLPALIRELSEQAGALGEGNLSHTESLLLAQAHALDAIFNNLAQQAARLEIFHSLEARLRLALKAQSQCRATLQTLAEIKNPPVVAKQANIAENLQVNNGGEPAALPKKIKNRQNELLGQ